MVCTEKNIMEFKIYSMIRPFLFRFILNKIRTIERDSYYVHGGGFMLNHLDYNIIDEIAEFIIDYSKDNNRVNCNLLLSVLYSDDADIVTSIDQRDTIANSIISNNGINFEEVFIKRLFCQLLEIPIDTANGRFSILNMPPNDSGRVSRIEYIIDSPEMDRLKKFVIADINGKTNYRHNDSSTIDFIVNEDHVTIAQRLDSPYMTKKDKRVLRILFHINMLLEGAVNHIKTTGLGNIDAQNIAIVCDICNTYTNNNNIIFPSIKKITDNKININMGTSYDYPNDIGELENLLRELERINSEKKQALVLDINLMKQSDYNLIKKVFDNYEYNNNNNYTQQEENKLNLVENEIRDFFTNKENWLIQNDVRSNNDNYNPVKQFTGNYYIEINNYITYKIYDMSFTQDMIDNSNNLERDNMIIRKLCIEQSRIANNYLFTLADDMYVYRGENYSNTFRGAYSNLKKNDTIITHNSFSTSWATPFMQKPVIMRIKLSRSSQVCYIGTYSQFRNEKEILLPFGTILKVIDIKEMMYNNEVKIVIDLENVGLLNINSIDHFVDIYKNIHLKIGKALPNNGDNPIGLVLPNNIQANIQLINNALDNFIPLVNLQELDYVNPINNASINNLENTTFANLPQFNTDTAYIGEQLIGNKNTFCINSPLNELSDLPQTNDSLNVLTMNVHNFVKICEPNHGRNMEHFEQFILSLIQNTKLDVICLQEISPNYDNYPYTQNEIKEGNFVRLVEFMSNNGFIYHSLLNQTYDSSTINPYYILGNGIFSKYPFIEKYMYGLANNRCLQEVIISFNGHDIRLINTHLEFNNLLMNAQANLPVIRIQIKQLVEIIISKHHKTIITGDFNNKLINDQNNLFDELLNYVKIKSPNNHNEQGAYTGFNSNKVIDYILMSNNMEHELLNPFIEEHNKIIKTDVSDHYPVIASFKFIQNNIQIDHKGGNIIDKINEPLRYYNSNDIIAKIKNNKSIIMYFGSKNTYIDYLKKNKKANIIFTFELFKSEKIFDNVPVFYFPTFITEKYAYILREVKKYCIDNKIKLEAVCDDNFICIQIKYLLKDK